MLGYYKIAGLYVSMDSFGKTLEQAKPYLIQEETELCPDISIISDRYALMKKFPHLGEDSCEYLSTGNSFYRQLIDHNGLLIHSSAVVMDGKAYLFSAPCGTGKSTHTALWQKAFGKECARILNDDKPAVRLENGEFFAYGTPWSGKTDLNINMRVPLAGVCMLKRGESNRIEPYKGAKALHSLLEQTARSKDASFMIKLLDLLEKLFQSVPVWQMECNMDPEAALVSYNAMSQGFENFKNKQ